MKIKNVEIRQNFENKDNFFLVDSFLKEYLGNKNFDNVPSYWIDDDPFSRPVRRQDLDDLIPKLNKHLTKKNLNSAEGLMSQRILMNIYEQDLIFLPKKNLNFDKFNAFYSNQSRKYGEYIRPIFEDKLFKFLENEIEISGGWTLEHLYQYGEKIIAEANTTDSLLIKHIIHSKHPEAAAKYFIIQCASDFLSEASAMARNCLGSYGPYLSELFKILIDEYGYGVHKTKHSQIFVDLMESLDLKSDIHYYWQFYTASSISLVNYFHYISKNHHAFFRYLGALWYTEGTLQYITKNQSKLLRDIFKDQVNTLYFDEHSHIDLFHGKMAFEKIIKPIVEQYGEQIIPEILRGFEEFKTLQELADTDLLNQIAYNTNLPYWKQLGTTLWNKEKIDLSDSVLITEQKNEISIPHCHDFTELLIVLEGEFEFIANPFIPITLKKNEAIVIPQYMHHGSKILSKECVYRVLPYEVNNELN